MRSINLFSLLSICLFFIACSGNKNEFGSDYKTTDSLASTQSPADGAGGTEKLVKTATINFQVKDVYRGTREISAAARRLGGVVMHQDIRASENAQKRLATSSDSVQLITSYSLAADMTVKIPSENLEDFLFEVGSSSSFIHTSNFHVDDQSLTYLAQQLKASSRERIIAPQLEKHNLKQKDALLLADQKDQLIDREIENKRIDQNVRYSTVELSFNQRPIIKKELIANDDLSVYNVPSGKLFRDAIASGWWYFESLCLAILHLWPFIIVAGSGWATYRLFKNRKKTMYVEVI
ncbi:DUF4349 domain-containing protein [Pedobacter sp. SYSU D00535]|uniref:DUF4349 domain-containing protein n=1 Tax=Pedobacter sp. SYSU D00535 TaxID=2810308 RepID=UPI001A95B6D2|nr:DUF4349 domain-containing protein [Pedobacter sp. SYSU D00535]